MNSTVLQQFPKGLLPLLKKSKDEIYLVGGAVRDLLLNKKTHDLDFVIDGNARKIARQVANLLGGSFFMLDDERNTARVLSIDENGSRNILDFAQRRGDSLIQDLKERDFTLNAMAIDLRSEKIIDPMKGVQDLKNKLLKPCSRNSIPSDPIRILRAIRLSLQFHLRIHPDLKTQIRIEAPNLKQVSGERIRDELFRLFDSGFSSKALRILSMMGIFDFLFPELLEERFKPLIFDPVWQKTITMIEHLDDLFDLIVGKRKPNQGEHLIAGMVVLRLGRFRTQLEEHFDESITPDRPIRPLLILAALLADMNFKDSQNRALELVLQRGKQLALSTNEIKRISFLVSTGDNFHKFSTESPDLDRLSIYRYFRKFGEAGIDGCFLAIAEYWAAQQHSLDQEKWDKQLQICENLFSAWWENHNTIIDPPQLINGNDLIQEFSLPPGPDIGVLLEIVREAQVEMEISTREDAFRIVRKWLQASD